MKFAAISITALAALLQAVAADFDIYRVGIGGNGISGNGEGWQVYQDGANCDNALNWYWRDTDDASGFGVRCEGDGCRRNENVNIDDITILEMNFRNGNHWTYYKDDYGGLYAAGSGERVGNCFPFSDVPFNCGLDVDRVEGYRKLRCQIDKTADEINAGRP